MRGLRTPRHGTTKLMVATALLFAAPLAAQDVTDVTLQTGIGFSFIGEDYFPIGKDDNFDFAWGVVVGVDFGLPVSGVLALRPGLSYMKKGLKRYLQVSLPVARHRVVSRGRLFLDIEVGPWFAIRTDSSNVGVRSHIEDTDLGLGAGPGVSYGITDRVAIHGATTYDVGFTDITFSSPSIITSPPAPPIAAPSVNTVRRTHSLALQAGVVFRI